MVSGRRLSRVVGVCALWVVVATGTGLSGDAPRVERIVTEAGDGAWRVTYGGGTAVVADPAALADPDRRGSRFARGGWIDSLKDRAGRELLAQTPIFPWHPAWGMPLEFDIVPELGKSAARASLRLVPGVGVVELAERRIVTETFPWQSTCTVDAAAGRVRLVFRQEGGAAHRRFALDLALTFDQRPAFTLDVTVKNTGTVAMPLRVALHPFLEPADNHDATRIRLPAGNPQREAHTFRLTELSFEVPFARRSPGWIAAGPLRSGGTLRLAGDPEPDTLVFWRSHDAANFAVEPMARRVLAPGETAEWRFTVHTE